MYVWQTTAVTINRSHGDYYTVRTSGVARKNFGEGRMDKFKNPCPKIFLSFSVLSLKGSKNLFFFFFSSFLKSFKKPKQIFRPLLPLSPKTPLFKNASLYFGGGNSPPPPTAPLLLYG